jgi:hypothetical protein
MSSSKQIKGGAIETFKNNILHNPLVLYFVFFLSLLYLFYFSALNDFSLIAIFILTGFITSFFSKNMVVILCISLVVSFLLRQPSKDLEGFEDKEPMVPLESSPVSGAIESDISKVKTEKKDLEGTIKQLDASKAQLPPADLEKLKDSYKELHSVGTQLLGTQEKIIANFQKIEPLIKDAENLVEKMNSAVDNMKTIVQKKA